jgi:protein-S-isoprenylcysteine O-methyltransferase Ste14
MTLGQHFEHSGNWLFRWRSYLPLIVLVFALIGFHDFRYPGGSHALQSAWMLGCLAVSLSGAALRMYTIGHVPHGTSGRNTKQGQIAETLNSTGIYSVVRHPLYLGNGLMWLGAAAVPRSVPVVVIVVLAFWLYHERIMFAEEAFLERKFGAAFAAWAERTPAFLPNLSLWRPPELQFSLRHAIRREYLGIFGTVTVFVLLEQVGHGVARGRFDLNCPWVAGWLGALVAFVVIRVIAKRTRWMHVEGR